MFLARGVTTPDEATTWMSLQAPHDPFLIPDMEQAVERLHRAVTDSGADLFLRRLRCRRDYGDQRSTCRSLEAWAHRFAPMSRIVYAKAMDSTLGAVQRLHDEGISLLVTSDCGTTSHHEIALAASSAWMWW